METAARAPAQTFRDLVVWQAHQFVLDASKLSQTFPRGEIYGLTSQFRRAAVSVAANIGRVLKNEGNKTKRDSCIAQGSLEECRYYLILIADLGYADTSQLNNQLEEVSKLLTSYANAVLSKC